MDAVEGPPAAAFLDDAHQMNDCINVGHRVSDYGFVEERPLHGGHAAANLVREDGPELLVGSDEADHVVPAVQKLAQHVAPHEPGGSGEKHALGWDRFSHRLQAQTRPGQWYGAAPTP